MAYDPECLRLAVHFLGGKSSTRLQDGLAQHIQDSIEDWLRTEANRLGEKIKQGLTEH